MSTQFNAECQSNVSGDSVLCLLRLMLSTSQASLVTLVLIHSYPEYQSTQSGNCLMSTQINAEYQSSQSGDTVLCWLRLMLSTSQVSWVTALCQLRMQFLLLDLILYYTNYFCSAWLQNYISYKHLWQNCRV